MQNVYKYFNAFAMKIDNVQIHRKKNTGNFIAMFHDVVRDELAAQKDIFSITEKNLISFLKTCSEKGYEIISLEQLLQEKNGNGKKCAITFDDGFESLFAIADPILKERDIPYTVFVTTSFLDKPGYLTGEMLKELSQNRLCTIAMHAHHHLMYRYESDAALQENYMECRNRIHELTGVEPSLFAFPYGSIYACSKHNCKFVKRMGAKAVFVTRQRMLAKTDLKKRWYIPRLNIPGYYNNTVAEKYRGIEV